MYQIACNEIKFLIWIQDNMRSEFLDVLMKFFTKIGDLGLIWIVFGLIFLLNKKNRKMGLKILLSLIFSALICNLILKNYVARIRPYDFYTYIDIIVEKQKDFSFPSGHTSASFAAAFSIYKSKLMYKKFNLSYIFIALGVLISFSRLYLFLHYPTDILAGIITGLLSAELAFLLVDKIYSKVQSKENN